MKQKALGKWVLTVDPDEILFKESLADLDTKYFFPETVPDYFQNNNKVQKHFDDFKSFLSHLNFTFKVICLSETWLHDAKHAESFNLCHYQMINRQTIKRLIGYIDKIAGQEEVFVFLFVNR